MRTEIDTTQVAHVDRGDRPDIQAPAVAPPHETPDEIQGYRLLSEDEARPKQDFDMFVSAGNWIELGFGVFWGFAHSDWRGAYKKHGAAGLVGEFFRYVSGTNIATIQIDRYSSWSGWAQEKLLKRHGVHLWDRRLTDFGRAWQYSIKLRQQNWAHYILLRAGVPVMSEVNPVTRARAEAYLNRMLVNPEPMTWWERLIGASPTPTHSETPNFQQQREGQISARQQIREDQREAKARDRDRQRGR